MVKRFWGCIEHTFFHAPTKAFTVETIFLRSACKGLLWNMEQSGVFAHYSHDVELSNHLPEYLLFLEEQKNQVESMILYTVYAKKNKALW